MVTNKNEELRGSGNVPREPGPGSNFGPNLAQALANFIGARTSNRAVGNNKQPTQITGTTTGTPAVSGSQYWDGSQYQANTPGIGSTIPQWHGRLNSMVQGNINRGGLSPEQMIGVLQPFISGGQQSRGGSSGISGLFMNALGSLFSGLSGSTGTPNRGSTGFGGGFGGGIYPQTVDQPNETGLGPSGPGNIGGGYNAYTGQYGYGLNYGPILGAMVAGEGPVNSRVRDYYRGPSRAPFAQTHGAQERQY